MSKIERSIPNFPQIYRIFEIKDLGREIPTNSFRVRKRLKVADKWTTRVSTFDNFEEAKLFARKVCPVETPEIGSASRFQEILIKFFHHKEFVEKVRPGTIAGYRSRAAHFRFFESLEMRQITSKVVDAWADLLLDPEYLALQQKSRSSYEHELVLLSVILKYYREFFDETFVHPLMKRHRTRLCYQDKSKERIRYLTAAQEAEFLHTIERWPVIHDLALLQLNTGMRVGEAAALEFDAIEFSNGQILVKQHLHWERKKNGCNAPRISRHFFS